MFLGIFISLIGGYLISGDSVPDFVIAIFVTIAIFFNCFAINMVLQYKKIGKWKNYLYGEKVYIILSLIAKSGVDKYTIGFEGKEYTVTTKIKIYEGHFNLSDEAGEKFQKDMKELLEKEVILNCYPIKLSRISEEKDITMLDFEILEDFIIDDRSE